MDMSGEKDRLMQDNTRREEGSSHNHIIIKFMFSFDLEFEREHTFRGMLCFNWKTVGRGSIEYSIAVSYNSL